MSHLSHNQLSLLSHALVELAAHCDNASSYDGQGFNKIDAWPGKKIAAKNPGSWNEWERYKAWHLSHKYRKQLSGYGIDVSGIAAPPKPERPPRPQKVWNPEEWDKKTYRDDEVADVASKIELNQKGHFVLTTPPRNDIINLIRQIPNRKWIKSDVQWVIYAVFQNMEPLTQLLSEVDFDVEAGVWERIEDVANAAIRDLADSARESAEFELPDDIGGTPYPFQRAGIAYAFRKRRVFIADDMGLGKSAQSIIATHMLGKFPCLVACPASVKLNWAKEITSWIPGASVTVIEGRSLAEHDPHHVVSWHGRETVYVNDLTADWIVCNYDLVPFILADLKKVGIKAVICDESHYLKNKKAKRSKACMGVARKADSVMLLSGTPMKNRHEEMINQLNMLNLLGDDKPFGSEWSFKFKFCDPKQGWGGRWDFSGSSNGEELNQMLRSTCMVRRKKEDVLKELPSITRSVIPVEISNRKEYIRAETATFEYIYEAVMNDPEARAELRHLIMKNPSLKVEFEQAIANKAEKKQQSYLRAQHLVRLALLRQLAARGKISNIIDWVNDFLESDEKIVLFAVHKSVQKALVDSFKGCAHVLGDDPAGVRQESVDRFQNDKDVKVIVCSLQAAAEGITLTAASNVAFVQYGWTPADHAQAEARIHRIGQTATSVNAWYLTAENTVEEDMYAMVQRKAAIVGKAVDGDTSLTLNVTFLESLADLKNAPD